MNPTQKQFSLNRVAFRKQIPISNLPLDDGGSDDGLDLGDLSFIEGDRPGSNLTYVEADSLAAIASLQHRLNELQTGARIVMA